MGEVTLYRPRRPLGDGGHITPDTLAAARAALALAEAAQWRAVGEMHTARQQAARWRSLAIARWRAWLVLGLLLGLALGVALGLLLAAGGWR
jgi:hypothetical protein